MNQVETGAPATGSLADAAKPKKFQPFGPRVHRFAFRPPEQDARMNVLSGSVRSGKTWGTLVKILLLCKYTVAGRKILTGVSKQAIYQNVLMDLFEALHPSQYNYNRQTGELKLLGSQWLVLGAGDEGSEKSLRGMTVGAAVCDELVKMPKSFFMMLLSRMSPEGSRGYCTTNPDNPFHWVKTELLDNPRLEHGLGRDIWWDTFTMADNPSLDPEFRASVQRSYTGVWYDRFILGNWVVASGGIFRDVLTDDVFYTDEQRPVGLLHRNGHQEHWISVDYGTVNPCVFIDVYDTSTTVYWDREWYFDSRKEGRQMTDAEYAEALITFIGRNKDQRDWPGIIIDPSAASFKAELLARGMYVIDANNEVDDGLRRLSTMLKRKLIKINRSCVEGIREMQSYCWDEKAANKGEDKPVKSHDHFPDAGRYHCQTRIGDWRIAA